MSFSWSRLAIRVSFVLAVVLGCMPMVAHGARPNVVVFVVDDLGYTDLGCYGSTFYETPNVDRLANSGVRFTDGYASCPVCSPSRASLMTGKYPQRLGVTNFIASGRGNQPEKWTRNTRLVPAPYDDRLPLEEVTVAEAFQEAGYRTFFAGKWHLGPKTHWPEHQGFDVNRGGCEWGQPGGLKGKQYFSPYRNPSLKDGPDGEFLTDRLAEETASFVRENREQPFFAWLSFYSVHTPLMAPDDRVQKYRERQVPEDQERWGTERAREVRETQNHAVYAAMVESMDRAVGRVLDELETLGLAENTIVVFTSDNGGLSTSEGHPTSNLPLRAGKGWPYEGGIRVPFIVRIPGGPQGDTSTTPVIGNDVFPTLLDAADLNLQPEQHVDGVSVATLVAGGEIDKRPLYWHYPHYGNQGGAPCGAIRRGDWKLIEWYEDNSLELYNLAEDIGEAHNLVQSHPDMTRELCDMLHAWRKAVGCRMPQDNPNYRN